jgi:hypothetical protein
MLVGFTSMHPRKERETHVEVIPVYEYKSKKTVYENVNDVICISGYEVSVFLIARCSKEGFPKGLEETHA